MAALLIVGFLCNLFITAVHERHHMEPESEAGGHGGLKEATMNARTTTTPVHSDSAAWGFVGIPLAWGVIETLLNALKLFE